MAILLDIAVVAVVVLFVFIGYKRGFVATVIQLAGSILALCLAFSLSGPVASGIYTAFIETPVRDAIKETIQDAVDRQTDGLDLPDDIEIPDDFVIPEDIEIPDDIEDRKPVFSVDELFDKLPPVVTNILKQQDGNPVQEFKDLLEAQSGKAFSQAAENVESALIRPRAVAVLRPIIIIVLFIILSALVGILSRAFKLIDKIPGLNSLNSILGAGLGLLQGVVAVILLVTIVSMISYMVPADSVISQSTLEKTVLVRGIEKISQ